MFEENYTEFSLTELIQIVAITTAQVEFGRILEKRRLTDSPDVIPFPGDVDPRGACIFALEKARNVWNNTCVEAANVKNRKITLYVRDPSVLLEENAYLWEETVKATKLRFDFDLTVAVFSPDPKEKELFSGIWNFFGPYLKTLTDGSKESNELLQLFFGIEIEQEEE